jgi:hypothetical protein
LVAGDKRTSDFLRRDFAHVQDDDGGDEADTETADHTTNSHHSNTGRGGLENAADNEDEATNDQSDTTPDHVSDITSDDGSKEGSGRENGCGQGLLPGRNLEARLVGGVGSACGVAGELDVGVFLVGVLLDEVGHGLSSCQCYVTHDSRAGSAHQNTTHPAGVVSEEDTAEGREHTHEISLHGDGGFDAVDIVGARNGDRSSWHNCSSWHDGQAGYGSRLVLKRYIESPKKGEEERYAESEGGEMRWRGRGDEVKGVARPLYVIGIGHCCDR